MSRLFTLSVAFIWFMTFGACAFAQTAPVASVPLAPWTGTIFAVLNAALAVLIPLILAWAVRTFSRWTHIKVTAQAQATLQTAASNGAGRILAAAEGDISKMSIPVSSPAVVAEAQVVAKLVPDALAALGVNPADAGKVLGQMIAGKVGLAQANATSPTIKIGA